MSDQYHTHTADEGVPQKESGAHVSSKGLGITLILMVLGTLAVIFLLVAYFNWSMSNYDAHINETSEASAASYQERQAVMTAIGTPAPGQYDQQMQNAVDQVIADYASNE